MTEKKSNRNSSIELLKLLGIFLIVTSHVVQTLESKGNEFFALADYWISFSRATGNPQILALTMLRYSGELGNTIFFVCSAWFLLESNSVRKKKIGTIWLDTWMISVLIMIIVLIIRGSVPRNLILRSFFPITCNNYWYINCYLLFYAIHPVLNRIINSLEKKQLFRLVFSASVVYCVIAFVNRLPYHIYGIGTNFFFSRLIGWTLIYFIMGFMKRHASALWDSKRLNYYLVLIGFLGNYGLIFLTNLIDLKTGFFRGGNLIWDVPYNPFIFALVFGVFNLFRLRTFVSRPVNYLSKLSLFIYVIHENLILRSFYRPMIWQRVYEAYGHAHVLGWAVALSLAVFAFSMICSIVYQESIHKLAERAAASACQRLGARWRSFENKALSRLKSV